MKQSATAFIIVAAGLLIAYTLEFLFANYVWHDEPDRIRAVQMFATMVAFYAVLAHMEKRNA